jgi:hypothetical protein
MQSSAQKQNDSTQKSSSIYCLYDAGFQLSGFLKDSVIYSVDGDAIKLIKGNAVIGKSGNLEGWADGFGCFFRRDGQLDLFSQPTDIKAPSFPLTEKFEIPDLSKVYEPVLCYTFLPSANNETRSYSIVGETALNVAISEREKQIESSRQMQQNYEMKQSANAANNNSKNFINVPGISNQYIGKVLQDNIQLQQQQLNNLKNNLTNVEIKNLNSIPAPTMQIEAINQSSNYGEPVTEHSKILSQIRNREKMNLTVKKLDYTSWNFEKSEQAYARVWICFDSACKAYEAGDYLVATQWCSWAKKYNNDHLNTQLLCVASFKMLGQYDVALDYLSKIKSNANSHELNALAAELYYLKDDRENAKKSLKKAFKGDSLGWAEYVQKKYNIAL